MARVRSAMIARGQAHVALTHQGNRPSSLGLYCTTRPSEFRTPSSVTASDKGRCTWSPIIILYGRRTGGGLNHHHTPPRASTVHDRTKPSCETRLLWFACSLCSSSTQGVYIFLFFKYADNVVRFVKLVHQIYWLLLPLFNYQNAMFHSQVYLWYLCFPYLTLCPFILFLSGTTCCWYIEGYICHFMWHLILLLH